MDTTAKAQLQSAREQLAAALEHPDMKRFQAEHPVQGRLAAGMITRMTDLAEVLSAPSPEALNQFVELSNQIAEIGKWLSPSAEPPKMTKQERDSEASRLQSVGWRFSWLEEYFRALSSGKRGRPATKRHVAVLALEATAANPQLPLWRIARDVCNCGLGADHDNGSACLESLRQTMRKLRVFLKAQDL